LVIYFNWLQLTLPDSLLFMHAISNAQTAVYTRHIKCTDCSLCTPYQMHRLLFIHAISNAQTAVYARHIKYNKNYSYVFRAMRNVQGRHNQLQHFIPYYKLLRHVSANIRSHLPVVHTEVRIGKKYIALSKMKVKCTFQNELRVSMKKKRWYIRQQDTISNMFVFRHLLFNIRWKYEIKVFLWGTSSCCICSTNVCLSVFQLIHYKLFSN
jgi:hypothetical protein